MNVVGLSPAAVHVVLDTCELGPGREGHAVRSAEWDVCTKHEDVRRVSRLSFSWL